MEQLRRARLAQRGARGATRSPRESARMTGALLRGPSAVGRDAIQATRITRQTIRGKDGGVYHVLAPGPSLLLAPAAARGPGAQRAPGHAGPAGGHAAGVERAGGAAGGRDVPAAARRHRQPTAVGRSSPDGAALLPPFVFYSFQFYPEMLGALVLTAALRWLLFVPRLTERAAWALGLGAGHAAVAPPEVPAGVGGARAVGGRPPGERAGADPHAGRDPAAAGADPLPDRALQLRDHRQREARRALPGLGPWRRQLGARRAGPPRPVAGRALRHRALRAVPAAGARAA